MNDKKTIRSLLLETRLTANYEDKILGEETIVNMFEDLQNELRSLKMEAHYGNCENCEPVMCCGGLRNECGCMGMPIDFEATDKCQIGCYRLLMKTSTELAKAVSKRVSIISRIDDDREPAETGSDWPSDDEQEEADKAICQALNQWDDKFGVRT